MDKPKCEECKKFDDETRRRLLEILGEDELFLIAHLMAAYIRSNHEMMRNAPIGRRMKCKQQMDFSSAISGKLIVGLSDEKRALLLQAVERDHGVVLQVNHQECPHEHRPTETVTLS